VLIEFDGRTFADAACGVMPDPFSGTRPEPGWELLGAFAYGDPLALLFCCTGA